MKTKKTERTRTIYIYIQTLRKDTTSVFDKNKENRENKDYIWTMRKETTYVFNENKENKENNGYTAIQESDKRL